MKKTTWYIIAPLVALTLLATATRLSAQDWKGSGRIAGRVVDDSGKPVANAVVSLRLVEAANTGPTIKTDVRGEFSALSLRGGTWNIDVEAPGYIVRKTSVTLGFGEGRVPSLVIVLQKDVALARQKELQVLVAKGDEFYKEGKFAEARAEYEKVLAARPDLVMVHRSIALAYGREQDYANALKELDVVLQTDPNDNSLLELAVSGALEMGDAQRAAQYLSRMDMASLSEPGAIVNLAIRALNKDQPNLAIQALDPMVAKFPQASDPYWYRALAELRLQQMDRAKADLEKFLPLAPAGSKQAEQAREMLGQIRQASNVASRFVEALRLAAGRPVVNPERTAGPRVDRAAAPAFHLRR